MQPQVGWVDTVLSAARQRSEERARIERWCRRCRTATRGKKYCHACRPFADQALRTFHARANEVLYAVGPLRSEWLAFLSDFTANTGIDATYGLEEIQPLTAETLRRYAAFATSDGIVTDEELQTFESAAAAMQCPPEVVNPLHQYLDRERLLGHVRSGRLPTVPVYDLHLAAAEICRLDVPAVLERSLVRGPSQTPGRLLLTDRKLRFIATTNGAELTWSKILRASYSGRDAIAIEASGRGLSGVIRVSDTEWVLAICDTLIRIDRRVVLQGRGELDTRFISQWMKSEVWQRDQGRCRQCGADSYLEFDHVIPLSRGGATSVNNLQLLCRRCNLQKGGRI